VIKKKGLLQATAKSGNVAGEGHAYLKSWVWWIGMIIMVVGEICNFAAFGEFCLREGGRRRGGGCLLGLLVDFNGGRREMCNVS
jgi:hypothetical protein